MKKIALSVLGICFSATVFAAVAPTSASTVTSTPATTPVAAPAPKPAKPRIESLNSIAAIVNQEIVTESELNHAVAETTKRFQAQNMPLPDTKTLRQQVLQQMILQKLQLQMAKQAHITVNEAEIDQAIANIAKQNNVTVAQLEQGVQAQEGVSLKQFREQLKKELLINNVEQMAVGGSIQISDEQVNKAYQEALAKNNSGDLEYHVGDILIGLPNKPTVTQQQAAEKQADDILKKLQNGADFSALARAVSNDNNAWSGGDLGWRKLSELPDLFVAKLKYMKAGQSAGPIVAPNGIHVIQLEGVRSANNGNNTTITKDQIRAQLFQQQMAAQLQPWLEKLQKSAYIKIMD